MSSISLHNLKNRSPKRPRKRVGRGDGNNWGKTCGRGTKGQKSRSGYSRRPYFEGGQIPLLRRLPKKGFNNPNHINYSVINVGLLEQRFDRGDTIDSESLRQKGLVKSKNSRIKVLAEGELSKALTVRTHAISASARTKIEAAGGTCELIASVPPAKKGPKPTKQTKKTQDTPAKESAPPPPRTCGVEKAQDTSDESPEDAADAQVASEDKPNEEKPDEERNE